jgi:hypothetical protein
MESGYWKHRQLPDGCQRFISLHTIVCRSEDKLYLLDTRDETRSELPIHGQPIWTESPGGKYLFYYTPDNKPGTTKVLNIVNLGTLEDREFARLSDVVFGEFPMPSEDGERIIAWVYDRNKRSMQLAEILPGEDSLRWIPLPGEQYATGDIAWAPGSARLAFGASDIIFDVGEACLNYLYVVDMATYQLQLVAEAPPKQCIYNFSFTGKVWSPRADKLAFTHNEEMCIYEFPTDTNECYPLGNSGSEIKAFVWSPDGAHLAYRMLDSKTFENHLGIFDLNSGQHYIIQDRLPMGVLSLEWW